MLKNPNDSKNILYMIFTYYTYVYYLVVVTLFSDFTTLCLQYQ